MKNQTNTKKQLDVWGGTSQEQYEIMTYYDKLKSILPSYTSVQDWENIEKAFQLALTSHAGTRRKSGEPYIIHPLRVALIVANEIGLGSTSIVSAIIHDVVEDTSVSINAVRVDFGMTVCKIVRGLTKIQKIFLWNKSMQAENFKKLLLNASEDNRIILVKLADRLDNMRYLSALPRQKQLRIAAETQQIYAPVAHRLGLNRVKAELEDLYLKYTYPKDYYHIAEKLAATRKERANRLALFSDSIRKILEKQKIKFTIENRVKSIYSIWRKITYSKIPFDQIYDLVALRIIVYCDVEQEKGLCWQIYGMISDMYPAKEGRLRDFISNPKANGYESLHATMMSPTGEWVEIQIRTSRMHEIAEKGVAAHWGYKKDIALGAGAVRLEKWLSEVRKLLEEGSSDSINLIEDFKLSLYDDEILVFNKEGTPTVLPKRATVLDYAIETLEDKWFMCSGAVINKRFLPINYELKNTEQVELVMNPTQKIAHYWTEIPKTAKARRVLKNFFQREYLSILQQGKKILRNELKKIELSINKNLELILVDILNEKSMEKIYYKIGQESISKEKLQKAIAILQDIKNKNPKKAKHPIQLQVEEDVIVTGDEDSQYQLANCCLPIPDEEIFGVLTFNEKVIIHRVDCPKAAAILSTYGSRVTKARWKYGEKNSFLVFLKVKAVNRKSMTKDIVNSIKTDIHIESLSFFQEEEAIKGNLTIEVEGTNKLSKVIKNLEHIPGMISVERMAY